MCCDWTVLVLLCCEGDGAVVIGVSVVVVLLLLRGYWTVPVQLC